MKVAKPAKRHEVAPNILCNVIAYTDHIFAVSLHDAYEEPFHYLSFLSHGP